MNKEKRKIIYVDMDNVLVDFPSGIAKLTDEDRIEYEGRYDDCPGIFAFMDPVPGAVEGFKFLAERFDVYILSTSPWLNPQAWMDKIEWVQKHFGVAKDSSAYKRLIISHHKNLNRGDYLIDDRTKNGASEFEGEHVLFGSEQFPDWKSVVEYLIHAERPVAENRDRFFQPFPDNHNGTYRVVPINNLIPTKTEPDRSVENALKHIRGLDSSNDGEYPRKPLEVLDNGDGGYSIVDGNATHAAAQILDWQELPVRVLESTHLLDRAIQIAAQVHSGQTDKAGAPYLLHPIRLMMKMRSDTAKIVAVLHDVVEDCTPKGSWTFERLTSEGFSEEIVEALKCVSKLHENEDYDEFIDRAMSNPIAREVKLADLEDNLNVLRINEMREKDLERIAKYHRSWHRLSAASEGINL
jgi:5'-nucleotidase